MSTRRITPPPPPPADPLLTAQQLAAELGMTPRYLADLRTRRRGPDYIRHGKLVRYRRSAIDRWLAAGEHTQAS